VPHEVLFRHPFPGPGLGVRVPGEVTPEKLAIARAGDAVFIRMLREHGLYDQVWQAYCALVPVRTVGVKGDERSYEFAVSLRAVVSEDAMTAEPAELDWKFLKAVASELLNQVPGVNRVLYDVSTKPPASIEWE
jgi:GMP synthase (glutamine-hydrolysing)